MGVMDVIKRIAENRKEKSEKFKEMEDQYMLEKKLMERQKSANKREYEDYVKKQEEDQIKKALDKIHKRQSKDNWKSGNSLIGNKCNMLKDDRPILKEKNIFQDNKNIFTGNKNLFKGDGKSMSASKQEMFFKW